MMIIIAVNVTNELNESGINHLNSMCIQDLICGKFKLMVCDSVQSFDCVVRWRASICVMHVCVILCANSVVTGIWSCKSVICVFGSFICVLLCCESSDTSRCGGLVLNDFSDQYVNKIFETGALPKRINFLVSKMHKKYIADDTYSSSM